MNTSPLQLGFVSARCSGWMWSGLSEALKTELTEETVVTGQTVVVCSDALDELRPHLPDLTKPKPHCQPGHQTENAKCVKLSKALRDDLIGPLDEARPEWLLWSLNRSENIMWVNKGNTKTANRRLICRGVDHELRRRNRFKHSFTASGSPLEREDAFNWAGQAFVSCLTAGYWTGLLSDHVGLSLFQPGWVALDRQVILKDANCSSCDQVTSSWDEASLCCLR